MPQPVRLIRAFAAASAALALVVAPVADSELRPFGARAASAADDPAALLPLVRRRIKHVFVLYQENRSFDSYFGTFPNAEGLYSHPAAETPGFLDQTLVDVDGKTIHVQPFRIGPNVAQANGLPMYAADTDDIDHTHSKLVAKLDIRDGVPQMDAFALNEEQKYWPARSDKPTLQAKQMGELAMAHEDCDTIPFLWRYADRFVLFDHIFQLMTGPSTPGNLSIIGAQTGETQAMFHPEELPHGDDGVGVPVLGDAAPFWGSPMDATPASRKLPVNPTAFPGYTIEYNLTYPTLPLTLAGRDLPAIAATDTDRVHDYRDIGDDVPAIARGGRAAIPWGWYEEGFDREPRGDGDDTDPFDAEGMHASYVTHHNAPAYFGYVANAAPMRSRLKGLADLWHAIDSRTLPPSGVFYVKGGYRNILGLHPANPDRAVRKAFRGDDDHPGYSDAEISEAMVAETMERIVRSPYWNDSAIVITWDDSEGDYDHVRPPMRETFPQSAVGRASEGARIPMIVISPYARTHVVDASPGDTASVVKLVEAVFGLPALGSLPDVQRARAIGLQRYNIANIGPHDDPNSGISDLTSAFDPARLRGTLPPLPPSAALLDPDHAAAERIIRALPHYGGRGCSAIGVTPTDANRPNPVPSDFNPRPKTNPTKT
ncbi:MAG TPA: alkaline phosphatase family protein [Candidatus Limnocylindrales bacterium]|nr:alkaline phosphatase family protein [Candidatus Limnocylindrales bacterium]